MEVLLLSQYVLYGYYY